MKKAVESVAKFHEKMFGVSSGAELPKEVIEDSVRMTLETLINSTRMFIYQFRGRRNPTSITQQRAGLLMEETTEVVEAMLKNDRVLLLDALADLMVVIVGTALAYDLPLEEGFVEVMRSNMTKKPPIDTDPTITDKGESYQAPRLKELLADHDYVSLSELV